MPHTGLLLPPGIVQPFPLGFRRDDYHVIAFLDGHPQYEAVEAMVSQREGDAFSVRAILTRHDQSQVDHINDPFLLEAMHGARREICERAVVFQLQDLGEKKRVRLEFESHRDERIVLDVTTLGPVSHLGAGLTDPGGHSPTSSLPIMFREASALAARESGVTIDGIAYSIRTEIHRGAFVANLAFFTEGFAMGVIRAGSRAYQVVDAPKGVAPGAEWRFEADGRTLCYRASGIADGMLRIARSDDPRETIIARPHGDRLELSEIALRDRSGTSLVLHFRENRFVLSLAGTGDLVAGEATVFASASGSTIALRPTQPEWARSRPVTVACTRRGASLELRTTIGEKGVP